MYEINAALIVMIVLSAYMLYGFYEGPYTSHFCTLYKERSKDAEADLIRTLNRLDLCKEIMNDRFDKFIYWRGEIIAGIIGETLVFKGSDSLKDLEFDFTPVSLLFKRHRTYGGILEIYKEIKPSLEDLRITKVVGWSLGAALSVLYASEKCNQVQEVVVYGLPPIFDGGFVADYNRSMGNNTRVHNHTYDIFANPLGVGPKKYIGTIEWVKAPITAIVDLLKNGMGYYHMRYFAKQKEKQAEPSQAE